MTWIIGVNTFMGYTFALSDIKVSWGNNFEKDCLQKFYPITNNISAGFAGSVSLGFKMLNGLVECIVQEKHKEKIIPEYIANKWSRKAKYIYKSAPLAERRLGCQLLMIGAFPKSQINIGPISNAKTALIKLCAPDFKPYIAKQHEIVSIGSGASVDEYKELLKWFDSNINEVFKFSEHIGLQAAFNILITDKLESNPKFGISKHLHLVAVDGNGVYVNHNDRQNEDGSYILKMPEVAKGYHEFVEMSKGYGFRCETAST